MTDDFRPDDQLWQELLEHGAADASLVAEFKRVIEERPWRPLGRILMDEDILTMKQVMGLLLLQADEPSMRIGDLAVREEYCTVEQIQAALVIQRESCPGPVELMLRDHRVSNDALMNALVGYIHHLEGAIHNYEERLQKQ